MKHLKPFRGLWIVFLAITIPSVFLLLFLQISAIRTMERNNASIISINEKMIVNSVTRSIRLISQSSSVCATSMDFLIFSNSSAPARVNKYAANMKVKLRSALDGYSEVVGFVLYNAACNKIYYSNIQGVDAEVFSSLASNESIPAGANKMSYNVTRLRDTSFIMINYQQHHGMFSIVLDPQYNENYRSYADSSDRAYALQFLPEDAPELSGTNYISQSFSALPLRLVMFLPQSQVPIVGSIQQLLILILICLIILAILFVGKSMQKQLIEPLALLWNAFGHISQGDVKYRIKQKTSLTEIDDFYRGFNQMLDTVQSAQQAQFKSEMDAIQAKMQYFQLQIRPHFYLNCLKNINALASIHEDQKIQEMVFLMSDYLRYIFQDNRSFLSLREELEVSEHYIKLCLLMGSPIELSVDVESDGLAGKCLPLAILTFLENSIKHRKKTDALAIHLSTKLTFDEDGVPYHDIVITDSGEGFPEDELQRLNAADPSELSYGKAHIGIANVRYRLWLVYGNCASVAFKNVESGAEVHVRFPFDPFSF